MPIRYSPFLLEAGTPLLLGRSPLDVFGDTLGLNGEGGVSRWVPTPVGSVPLPSPIVDGADVQHRWPGVDPQWLKNPLFWLPKRLAYPFRFEDGTVEDLCAWQARVFVEIAGAFPVKIGERFWVGLHSYAGVPLQVPFDPDAKDMPLLEYDLSEMRLLREASDEDLAHLIPLYDRDSGGWLDVPFLAGVDVDTPRGLERVQSWLSGGSDPDLDRVDLESLLVASGRDLGWAQYALDRPMVYLESGETEVASFFDDVFGAGQYMLARDMCDVLLAEQDEGVVPSGVELTNFGLLAQRWLVGVGEGDDSGLAGDVRRVISGGLSGGEAAEVLIAGLVAIMGVFFDVGYRLDDRFTGEQRELVWELRNRHGVKLD